jgi:post-segregation antitoxin (ccd killing protein)
MPTTGINDNLGDALQGVLRNISQTGLWLEGAQRRAIALLARDARETGLSATAKAKLSPSMVDWRHSPHELLSPPLVEAARRIAVDASRLTEQAVQAFFDEGVHPGEYSETIAVVASITALDTFHRGMGYPPVELLDPDTAPPQRVEPTGSVWDRAVCWLPSVPPEAATGELAAWYSRGHDIGNLFRTITYAPNDAITFFGIQGPMYAEGDDLFDFANSPLALHKTQVEVIATRVSSFNDCFY